MQIKHIMSKNIEFVKGDTTIHEVAQKMLKKDTGAILVGDHDKMTGIITDRDIVMKVIAEGRDPKSMTANDIMSAPLLYCYDDQEAEDVADNMIEQDALRMFVVDSDKRACGILSHSDLADAIVKNSLYFDKLAEKVVKLASKVAAAAA